MRSLIKIILEVVIRFFLGLKCWCNLKLKKTYLSDNKAKQQIRHVILETNIIERMKETCARIPLNWLSALRVKCLTHFLVQMLTVLALIIFLVLIRFTFSSYSF